MIKTDPERKMSAENTEADLCLPAAPRGLCFDRLDFVKTNFSVDAFLSEHGDSASLETMRDDLGAYLKVLRLAMIELINRDYANFVSLSATLVGFDKAVEKIQAPLGQLKDEVLNVKQSLDEAMHELSIWRNQESMLRQKKLTLKYYSQTLASFNCLSKILKLLEGEDAKEISIQTDRAAMQYNQLKFTVTKCGSLINNEQQTLFSEIGEKLNQTLNDLLFSYWSSDDEEGVLRTLLTLATLNKVSETEKLLRKKAVAPCLQDLIAESNLQRDPKGLSGIYEKILALLDNELKLLVTVMQHSKLAFLVNKYNFLINCFWSEVESRLEIHLASIFAPGNPKIFYSRYSDSMEFLRRLEEYCPDAKTVEELRNTPEYRSFQKRWNLPVYFQIRFQEIAGSFEASLSVPPSTERGEWRLAESASCWRALHECWMDGVFVRALAHKFWRLSLQLLSRYVTWVLAVCENKPRPTSSEVAIDQSLIQRSVYAYLDVNRTLSSLPDFLQMVKTKVQLENTDMLDQSLTVSRESLRATIPKVRECVVNELFEYYSLQLKQVTDIPRLYRKTNRSVPTRPCGYIETVSKAMKEFRGDYKELVNDEFLAELFGALFTRMTESYYSSVEDVLTSVQKTEESLRRLKQIRDKNSPQPESAGVSDGDKIRLQISVDVTAYRRILQELQVDISGIGKFEELDKLVTQAVKDVDIK